MIDYENMRTVIAKGLKEYLGCPVIRSNQNTKPPKYPYVSYTITVLMSQNKGTYGVYEDGTERKPFVQTWSITALSDDNSESVMLACKAREWLDRVGSTYLNENGVIVQSVGSVTNRDNFLTTEYEYRNGFDAFFWLMDEVEGTAEKDGYIESTEIFGGEFVPPPSTEQLNQRLENRLDGEVS